MSEARRQAERQLAQGAATYPRRPDSRFWHPFADMSLVRHSELVIERGRDVWVWDEQGRRYLDATAALWYANVGHGRKAIVDAITAQASRIAAYNAFGDFATRPALDLSDRLSGYAPGDDWRVFLTSGGGDGIETAAKLERLYFYCSGEPRRTAFISRHHAYHGTHGWGTALGGIPANRGGFVPPGSHTDLVPVAHDSARAMGTAVECLGDRLAAIFVEPVIGAEAFAPSAPNT
jgi:putrescine---pyruvate transaminase